eukprot:gene4263-6587_t
MHTLETLDDYLLERVAKHLDIVTLARLAQTCRKLYYLSWPVVDLSLVTHKPCSRVSSASIVPWQYIISKRPQKLVISSIYDISRTTIDPLLIFRLSSLRQVILCFITIDFALTSEIQNALKVCKPNISRIEICGVFISGKNLGGILSALSLYSHSLQHVVLSSMALTPMAMSALATLLAGGACRANIKVLEIDNCYAKSFDVLGQALSETVSLTKFYLTAGNSEQCSLEPIYLGIADSRAPINTLAFTYMPQLDIFCCSVQEMIENASFLKHLALPPVQPDRNDLHSIISTLKRKDTLISFEWSGITLTVTAILDLWEWVMESTCLQHLTLKHCDLAGPNHLKNNIVQSSVKALAGGKLRSFNISGSDLFISRNIRRHIIPITVKRKIEFIYSVES